MILSVATDTESCRCDVNGFGIDLVGDFIGNVAPNTWPFHCDLSNMGAVPASDFAVMFSQFGDENSNGFDGRNEYIIIHHIPTGRRLRIFLPQES